MPYIPHTDDDVKRMLDTIGVNSIDDLFDEIPQDIIAQPLQQVPPGKTEMETMRIMNDRAAQDGGNLCFIGAGAYEHHIPAAVWEIASRGEFLTAYTPYQAEASQGTLQVIYEYQSMIAHLCGMDVSNASLYDGGSGLSEAVLMAVRANRKSKSKKALVLTSVNPLYRQATTNIVENQGLELVDVAYCSVEGTTPVAALKHFEGQDFAALIIQQPNFFGSLEDVDALTDWAHANGMLVIASVNPTSLALLKPPGEWGEKGADIAVGEGQPLGVPLSSGGPYFGFITCKQQHVRQMPGRIIGRTVDMEGRPGFALTLQAREQHIRRSKATSNICTNQGLAMTAATVYMSLLGADGLQQVAVASHNNTQSLLQKLTAIDGVEKVFSAPTFHEVVIRIPGNAADVLKKLADKGIQGGVDLSAWYAELENCILLCATETKIESDLERYAAALQEVL
ncbi:MULTISPECIES: aminomethyl-transferring glycine dehydrogenase subunit GcvPA [unclassified Ketobacter]|jgi:glycine dehydrogenase subunit 1|uniref:aminomethyl-transferring glycine dehydrogenase subunit GcvPA n=1 Tax=unclassified Ketobacter TaxID=2639109 RepID=UPI000F20131D|nr:MULTISPECIES: aminomethyl-transferring glycine dehydrogenase subunit GcvPA [unclassified Ketobacter]MEC8811634.1 aminomethyl-transferring glycine dehydrogenase subunit GcvPA [Pseudomonadota bacterium]RLT91840.1 MAG: aminomethyl-transferring glycine dehydrogenase subunit GcvPA [Ketobacter sp. GenoA1]RLT93934.1 MAG: aminomethyl-transferring glycine dehydrogenase subunit GcvPA [Ketobacter sp.]